VRYHGTQIFAPWFSGRTYRISEEFFLHAEITP
jgi:hypothetical protein